VFLEGENVGPQSLGDKALPSASSSTVVGTAGRAAAFLYCLALHHPHLDIAVGVGHAAQLRQLLHRLNLIFGYLRVGRWPSGKAGRVSLDSCLNPGSTSA
jgi:hypothetical protein